MEREFKWSAARADFDAICAQYRAQMSAPVRIQMDAVYSYTPDRLLRAQRIGMRLRQENGTSVFCVKTGGKVVNGLHTHAEYEYPAETLEDGLAQLPDELSMLRRDDYAPICGTHIRRTAILLTAPDFTAELTFDEGELEGGANRAPLSEIECEQKSGDPAAFDTFGAALADAFSLKAEPLSKLARALALADR
ncbi:MAG: CYTH domain-containing protein [Butyricicoccus sp.]|nr:CYTH domain-containing protein [Butyricicoccus sp.]